MMSRQKSGIHSSVQICHPSPFNTPATQNPRIPLVPLSVDPDSLGCRGACHGRALGGRSRDVLDRSNYSSDEGDCLDQGASVFEVLCSCLRKLSALVPGSFPISIVSAEYQENKDNLCLDYLPKSRTQSFEGPDVDHSLFCHRK